VHRAAVLGCGNSGRSGLLASCLLRQQIPPESPATVCSPHTEAARLTAALVDQAGTTMRPCQQEILDIDDTFCAAHGGQQLAFWNAHHDERCFASTHIYHVASDTPVATILRPARTPRAWSAGTPPRCHPIEVEEFRFDSHPNPRQN
jgi:Transposase DDE domain group 1